MKNTKNSIRMRLTAKSRAKRALLFLLCAALVLGSVGCSDTVEENVTPTPTPVVADSDTATAQGVLVTAVPANYSTLDPLLVDTKEVQSLLSLVYEPLLSYDSSSRLTSCLAETWSTTDGGVTWTINLRRSVRWHGSEDTMNANDVIYTYRVLQTEAYADSVYASCADQIASIEAVDEYTLVVTGKQAGMSVLYALTFPIVSREHFTENAGTGPYVLTAADSTVGIELTANQNWWKRTPYIQKVQAVCMTEGSALNLYSIHEINFAPTNSVTASTYREEGVTNVYEVNTQHCEVMYLNHNSARLSDVRVRQAIAYALDRRDIISQCYYNHMIATDVPVPPDSWLYDSASKIYDTNLEKAANLLEEAGWKDYDGDGVLDSMQNGTLTSLRLTLLVNDTPDDLTRRDAAELIREQLAQVGIAVDIITASWTAESDAYVTSLQSGGFDMALAGINLGRSYDLAELISTGGSCNYGHYSSEEMDNLLARANSASTEDELKERMSAVMEKFTEDLPFIQLYFRTYSVVYSAKLVPSTDIRDTELYRSIERWYFTEDTDEYESLGISGVPALSAPDLSAVSSPSPSPENTGEPDEE